MVQLAALQIEITKTAINSKTDRPVKHDTRYNTQLELSVYFMYIDCIAR